MPKRKQQQQTDQKRKKTNSTDVVIDMIDVYVPPPRDWSDSYIS